jgi:hypothetical protein
MKKIGIIIAIAIALVLTGCASSGGGGGGAAAPAGDMYVVDLSLLPETRNAEPFQARWGDFFIYLPEFPVDVTQYTRITIRTQDYDEDLNPIAGADSNAMITIGYDPSDWATNPDSPNIRRDGSPNHIIKEFNLGGFSGQIGTDRGTRVRMSKAPGFILIQVAQNFPKVRYVEIKQFVFHNDKAPPL